MENICWNVFQLFVFPQINSIEQEGEGRVLFHQGSVPPDFSHEVRNALNVRFHSWWIGRGRPTQWPPRSPDLSVLDIFCGDLYKVAFMERKPEIYVT
jgi:hypothetical protein